MRAHQLKINLTKSFLGVSSEKFLSVVVTVNGIHLNPEKIKAIQGKQPPKNIKDSKDDLRTSIILLPI